jgi:hypothetical protein
MIEDLDRDLDDYIFGAMSDEHAATFEVQFRSDAAESSVSFPPPQPAPRRLARIKGRLRVRWSVVVVARRRAWAIAKDRTPLESECQDTLLT